jgi:endonuclease/exonuclease/phosphatase family metal-dependent hydrolase
VAFYPGIDPSTKEGQRIAARLLSVKSLLRKRNPAKGGIPHKTLDQSLLIATWNVRELGRNQKYGRRLFESLYYIAEIISAFDIVALQEVNEDLGDFLRIMSLLGPSWKYLLTDITLGRQGNGERMAFVYDSRKVDFGGLASQVIIPPEVKRGTKTYHPARQLARAPMMVGFTCGWFRFTICTTHIFYGATVADEPTRLAEIKILAKLLAERANSEHAWAQNMLLLGDFNIFKPSDDTASALAEAGFFLPPQLKQLESNDGGKHYDQIAMYSPRFAQQQNRRAERAPAGVVKFLDKIFTDDQESLYAPAMGQKYATKDAKRRQTFYRAWRTFQISDHRPMWIELTTDFSSGYLANAMRGKGRAFPLHGAEWENFGHPGRPGSKGTKRSRKRG